MTHAAEDGELYYVPAMDPAVEAALIAGGFGILTVAGTLYVQVRGSRRTSRDTERTLKQQLAEQREQLDRTLAAQREQLDRTLAQQRDRTLNERFATAADRLGGDKPPAVRLTGVYAMAGLADDWPDNRQTCVDILCAYLRLPHDPHPGDDAGSAERAVYQANREVRHSIIRLIGAHLRPDADPAKSWQGLNFDFTGVVFDGGDFSGTRFSGGIVQFAGASFVGGLVDFGDAEFSGGKASFIGARFSGGDVWFMGAKFSGAQVDFNLAEFSGARVSFGIAEFSGGQVSFGLAKFSGGQVEFDHAQFSGGQVSFGIAKFCGGQVDFAGAEFSGGQVDFAGAQFSGGQVDFNFAEFSGGQVSFDGALDWSHPPKFDWENPPAGVMLPADTDAAQA
jgi:uncharacterized protein YjbI with pentapeptide repeats